MNVLIAKNTAECAKWKDTAVVVDVLRSATTVCALLVKNSSRTVVVCPDEQNAQTVIGKQKGFVVLSENALSLKHEDDSPYIASRLADSTPVCLVSNDAGLALQYLRNASTVLLGGFCNFRAVVQAALAPKKDILLVPAAIFQGKQDEEDFLFAQAFKEFVEHISNPEKFLEEFNTTVRFVEFRRNGSPTALQDLEIALTLDNFSLAPRAVCSAEGHWAVCFPYGAQPSPAWASLPDLESTVTEVPQFTTMLKMDLRPMVDKTLLATHLLDEQFPQQKQGEKSPKTNTQGPSATQLRNVSILGEEKTPTQEKPQEPKKGLKGFFSNLVNSGKTDTPAETSSTPEPMSLSKPTTEPEQLSAKDAPKREETPEEIAAENAKTHIDLSDGKTVWNISKPRPGMFTQVPEDETMHVKWEQISHEDIPQDAPITQAPNPNRPQERVLELSVFEHGDTKLPLRKTQPHLKPQPQENQTTEPVAQEPQPVQQKSHAETLPQTSEPVVRKTAQPHVSPAASVKQPKHKKAIVLFSGGLDSTTCLYWARSQGYECEALTVSYGQRHRREIAFAQAITRHLGIKHHLIDLKLPWLATSSLVDKEQPLPDNAVEQISHSGVPSTYVPGRNLMFLAIAGSLLDAIGADAIIAGPNAVDFSGYPDCTPGFYKAAGEALNRGTTRGVREGIEVLAPLMEMNKADIVRLAVALKVPLKYTWSCYAGGDKPCGKCDSCKLRAKGFKEAGYKDPAL